MIVSEATYETTEPTVDSQIVKLRNSNADILMNFSIGKFTAQSIRKVHELGWDALHFVPYTAASSQAVLKGAGFDKAKGIISSAFYKSSADPKWSNDAEYLAWQAWMKKYYPSGDISDDYNVGAYVSGQLLEQVLLMAGDDLSRENIIRIATGLQHVRVPMLLPGIDFNSNSRDYALIKELKLVRFDGEGWITLEHLSSE
jgi:ABC-type branched-subunit amino acid transport system substrate-binding protein